MAHWINVLRINGFVNPTRLPLLCEKTGALAIVEPGLTIDSRGRVAPGIGNHRSSHLYSAPNSVVGIR